MYHIYRYSPKILYYIDHHNKFRDEIPSAHPSPPPILRGLILLLLLLLALLHNVLDEELASLVRAPGNTTSQTVSIKYRLTKSDKLQRHKTKKIGF
jgi:hypothetical protein